MNKNEDQKQGALWHVRWMSVFLLLLGVILVGGVVIAARASTSGGAPSSTGSSPSTTAISSPLTPPVPLTATYDEAVKEQVAQGLHLTVAQVRTQLQANPTGDLMQVAKPQGLAQDQVYRLLMNALQIAGDHMVSSGAWTQQQADKETQYWRSQNVQSIIDGVTGWFRQSS